ncbi:MAG: hypothetical protein DRP08_04795 [Candidatus Aenigmatarchaeota archaeon]|nr:MAG: hypothetical protein DRP08_04795 [Candidatus Aenigmarchaeota archaeon]
MSNNRKVIPLTGKEKIQRKSRGRSVIPYDQVIEELKAGRGVFVENVKRQTASYAAKKLSRMLGKKVVQYPVFLKMEGKILEGYTFELENSED